MAVDVPMSAKYADEVSIVAMKLAALSVLMGLQSVLAFLAHDIASTPRHVLHRRSRAQ